MDYLSASKGNKDNCRKDQDRRKSSEFKVQNQSKHQQKDASKENRLNHRKLPGSVIEKNSSSILVDTVQEIDDILIMSNAPSETKSTIAAQSINDLNAENCDIDEIVSCSSSKIVNVARTELKLIERNPPIFMDDDVSSDEDFSINSQDITASDSESFSSESEKSPPAVKAEKPILKTANPKPVKLNASSKRANRISRNAPSSPFPSLLEVLSVETIDSDGDGQDQVLEVTDEEFNYLRFKSQFKLKSAWERICEKYGRSFDEEADEIDIVTGKILIDKGCVKNRTYSEIGGTVVEVDERGVDEAWALAEVREKFLKTQSLLNSADSTYSNLEDELKNGEATQIPQVAQVVVADTVDSRIEDATRAVAITLAVEKLENGDSRIVQEAINEESNHEIPLKRKADNYMHQQYFE